MPLFRIHCILFIVLAIATSFLHERIAQYEPIGPDLLTGKWNIQASEGGLVEITENGLILHSSVAHMDVSAYQFVSLPQPGTILKLSAEARSADVLLGQKPWHLAKLMLVQNNGKKDDWDLPHTTVAFSGSHAWANHHNVFTIAPETQQIRVVAQLNQASGFFQLKNIRLHPVSESPAFPVIRNIMLVAWGAFFLLLMGSCFLMREANVVARLLLIPTALSIIIGTTMPGDIKQEVSDEVITQISAESEQLIAHIPWDLSKVWHFGFFFFFGIMLGFVMTRKTFLQMIAVALMVSGGTEFAQFYIDGRTPLIADFFLDASGSILGLILVRLIRF